MILISVYAVDILSLYLNIFLPIGGLHNPAAIGIIPRTILISPYDNPICLACKIKKGYKPNKAINSKIIVLINYLMLISNYKIV